MSLLNTHCLHKPIMVRPIDYIIYMKGDVWVADAYFPSSMQATIGFVIWRPEVGHDLLFYALQAIHLPAITVNPNLLFK